MLLIDYSITREIIISDKSKGATTSLQYSATTVYSPDKLFLCRFVEFIQVSA